MLTNILNIVNNIELEPSPPLCPITSNCLLLTKIHILPINPNLNIKCNGIISMKLYNYVRSKSYLGLTI